MPHISFTSHRGWGNVVIAAFLFALEIAALDLLFGIDVRATALFAGFFLSHVFLTGLTVYLIFAGVTTEGRKPLFNIVTIGIIADCAILILCWRFDVTSIYRFYPIACILALAALSRGSLLRERIVVLREPVAISLIVVLQVIPPLLWLFSVAITAREMTDQIFGAQSVMHWPPPNLAVADLPYSNNYGLHLLLDGIHRLTQIDLVLLVSRLSPIFLLWMFGRSLIYFCRRVMRLPLIIALLPGLCFFIVVGFSHLIGRIFATPTVTAALWVQSPLFSFPIFLLVLTLQSLRPRSRTHAAVILGSIAVAAFVGTGARAQLGPILICAQLLLLMPAIMKKDSRLILWRMAVLAVLSLSILAALEFFLTLLSGFSGVSFLRIDPTPWRFISDRMRWYHVAQWLSDWGVGDAVAGGVAFAVIVVLQSSFMLPGLVVFLWKSSRDRFAGLSPIQVLLLGVTIAGICAVCLTEAPGGSQYVFMQYSKIASTILGACGLYQLFSNVTFNGTAWKPRILAATVLLAAAQGIDAGFALYQIGGPAIAAALRPSTLPNAEQVRQLRQFFGRYDDRKRSVFIYYSGLSVLGPSVLPIELGLQSIGSKALVKQYAEWPSYEQTALQRRLCLLGAFNDQVKSGTLDGNLVYALGNTLLRHYETLYVIVPASTTTTTLNHFEVRSGPEFKVFRIPMSEVRDRGQQPLLRLTRRCGRAVGELGYQFR